jgi:hypothetical protein
MAELEYLVDGVDGWLRVKREPSGEIVALPEYLKVDVTSREGGRDHFTVLEGTERNKHFSVLAGNLRGSDPGYRASAGLQFSLSLHQLTFPGGSVRAITDDRNPVPIGQHPIQIPDFPHDLGFGYLGQSRFATSWFYLGTGRAIRGRNDRYLHTGRASAGCITVDPSGWTALYKRLILSRSGNGTTVGTVSVVG